MHKPIFFTVGILLGVLFALTACTLPTDQLTWQQRALEPARTYALGYTVQ